VKNAFSISQGSAVTFLRVGVEMYVTRIFNTRVCGVFFRDFDFENTMENNEQTHTDTTVSFFFNEFI